MDGPSQPPSRRGAGERAAAGAGLSLEIDDDGIAVIEFDQPGVEHNRFTPELLERLGTVLDGLHLKSGNGDLAGVLLTSAKPDSFFVGVDVAAIAAIRDAATAVSAARRGQEIFHKLAVLPVPTVVAINGTCLGGATEMALACTWRLAADSRGFEIGLPEVNLGIFSGFGGSQRLPRTISLERSLQMILTGKSWNARRAYKAGLVDSVVAPPILVDEARRWLREKAPPRRAARRAPEDRGFLRRLRRWLLEGQPLGRTLVFRQARKGVLAQTGGHYPAPLQAINTVRRGLRMPLPRALELEAERVGRLVVSPVARNLVGIFFSRRAARRAAKGVAVPTVGKLAVVGAGVMGGGIAQLAAYYGIPVRVKDVAPEALTTGLAVASKRFKQRQRAGKLSKIEAARRMDLISPTLDYTGFATVDLVVEAVVERLEVKRSVLAKIEAVTGPETILATNTSSLTLADLAQSLNRPEQLVGLHFFNPVHRMPLVEVVRGEGTSAEAVDGAVAFAGAMGKVPVVIGDAPGFFVNRVLGPYLNEAVMMVEAGVGIERIDSALRRFGMPMGPLRLLDEIGIDVSEHAAAALGPVFGDRLPATSANRKLREAGQLGRKAGRGFYRYDGRRERPDASIEATLRNGAVPDMGSPSDDEIVDRCVLLILNETCMTLAESVVESPRMADLALVMGTGFAPFRGGILRYADEIGVGRVRDRLQALAEVHGPRFVPAPLLAETADSGAAFYPEDWPVP